MTTTPAEIIRESLARSRESLGQDIDSAATSISATIVTEAAAIAATHMRDAHDVASDIMRTIKRMLPPPPVVVVDGKVVKAVGRSGTYMVRVQVIAPQNEGLLADSDPEMPDLDAPGVESVVGLAGVAEFTRELVTAYHDSLGETVTWPSRADIERRIKTIRVILSRGGGRGRWRIHYDVGPLQYTAFVLVVKKSEL